MHWFNCRAQEEQTQNFCWLFSLGTNDIDISWVEQSSRTLNPVVPEDSFKLTQKKSKQSINTEKKLKKMKLCEDNLEWQSKMWGVFNINLFRWMKIYGNQITFWYVCWQIRVVSVRTTWSHSIGGFETDRILSELIDKYATLKSQAYIIVFCSPVRKWRHGRFVRLRLWWCKKIVPNRMHQLPDFFIKSLV